MFAACATRHEIVIVSTSTCRVEPWQGGACESRTRTRLETHAAHTTSNVSRKSGDTSTEKSSDTRAVTRTVWVATMGMPSDTTRLCLASLSLWTLALVASHLSRLSAVRDGPRVSSHRARQTETSADARRAERAYSVSTANDTCSLPRILQDMQ